MIIGALQPLVLASQSQTRGTLLAAAGIEAAVAPAAIDETEIKGKSAPKAAAPSVAPWRSPRPRPCGVARNTRTRSSSAPTSSSPLAGTGSTSRAVWPRRGPSYELCAAAPTSCRAGVCVRGDDVMWRDVQRAAPGHAPFQRRFPRQLCRGDGRRRCRHGRRLSARRPGRRSSSSGSTAIISRSSVCRCCRSWISARAGRRSRDDRSAAKPSLRASWAGRSGIRARRRCTAIGCRAWHRRRLCAAAGEAGQSGTGAAGAAAHGLRRLQPHHPA